MLVTRRSWYKGFTIETGYVDGNLQTVVFANTNKVHTLGGSLLVDDSDKAAQAWIDSIIKVWESFELNNPQG